MYDVTPRRPARRWQIDRPLTIGSDALDDLPRRLAAHDGPIALTALDAWAPAELEALRFAVSCEPLDRPAPLEGAALDVDTLLDRIVAALDAPDAPARRARPEGLSVAEAERVQAVMYSEPPARFYVDGVREALDQDLLYDLFEEALFPQMWEEGFEAP